MNQSLNWQEIGCQFGEIEIWAYTRHMLLAVVWHWWIGFVLSASALFLIIAVIVGYFMKVENPKYPKK